MSCRRTKIARLPKVGKNPGLGLSWNFFFGLGLLLLVAIQGTGCRKTGSEQALESDANAYLCTSCDLKFYTDSEVFAEFCPKCKEAGIETVSAFVCGQEGQVVLAPKKGANPSCPKCLAAISAIRLPRTSDLQSWGAAKKSRAEVCRS